MISSADHVVVVPKGGTSRTSLISKESSAANTSFRVYYGVAAGAVPFLWESQPGTPKHMLISSSSAGHSATIPPLTPPPSYFASPTPPPPPPPPPPHGLYKASPSPSPAVVARGDGGSAATRSARLRKSRTEDLLEKSVLLLRAFAGLFSLIALIVLASNKHGDWQDFDRYQEYRYLLIIAVLASVYSMAQVLRQVKRSKTGMDLVPAQYSWIVDFAGDQVMAYLLISALSAAIPITNHMRETVVNIFTDASAASISMAFLSFVALAVCALISGFQVSKQNYV